MSSTHHEAGDRSVDPAGAGVKQRAAVELGRPDQKVLARAAVLVVRQRPAAQALPYAQSAAGKGKPVLVRHDGHGLHASTVARTRRHDGHGLGLAHALPPTAARAQPTLGAAPVGTLPRIGLDGDVGHAALDAFGGSLGHAE